MLERGLRPFATLYHWDLPCRHAEQGGWTVRQTPLRFADFTDLVMRHFGDRLETVAPVNEPWCVSWLSHYWGAHAPGLKDLSATAKAMHFIQLAHGLSVEVMRGHGHKQIGCVLNKELGVPADDTSDTYRLTQLFDGIYNRWFEESIFKGCYPDDVLAVLERDLPAGYQDDLQIINQPLDWAGVNYYTRSLIAPDKTDPHVGFRCIRGDLPKTDMGWEIVPEGLRFSETPCPRLRATCRYMSPKTAWRTLMFWSGGKLRIQTGFRTFPAIWLKCRACWPRAVR